MADKLMSTFTEEKAGQVTPDLCFVREARELQESLGIGKQHVY